MLYCDAKGNVDSALIDESVYKHARNNATKMKRTRRNFATVGAEIEPGKMVPLAVEIGADEAWALNNILEHAMKRREIPDILKKYTRQIIKLGESKHKELERELNNTIPQTPIEPTPKVLYRLPYYPPDESEVSIPIYKAEHSYPLIVLKRLPPNGHTGQDMARVLILDSDGDLAIIKVPSALMDRAGKDFNEWKKANQSDGCLICSRHPDGLVMGQLVITRLQRRALNGIVRHFEKTGHGAQPVSSQAQSVVARARDITFSTDS